MKKKNAILVISAIVFLAVLGTIRNNNEKKDKNLTSKKNSNNFNKNLAKTKFCIYGEEKSFTIPGLIAADIYVDLQNKGFKIEKQIKNDYTSIYCESRSTSENLNVVISGCSPDEIVAIEASAVDYTGNKEENITNFLAYVATLHYQGSEPEKAKTWVKENININGAKTVIGSVTFLIAFKSNDSKFLTIQINN